MIPRYTRPEMGRIFTDQNRFEQWLAVELAAGEALAETGEVPAEAARLLREHASFDVERIHAIEREVKHDVIAFTTAVAERMAAAGHQDASRWLHYGLTSNDVVDTAQALQLKQASALLLEGQARLRDVRSGLASWLDEHDLTLREARGMLSQMACADTRAYERAQYVQAIGAANAS